MRIIKISTLHSFQTIKDIESKILIEQIDDLNEGRGKCHVPIIYNFREIRNRP